MKVQETGRGFQMLVCPAKVMGTDQTKDVRLVQQSSAIGDYEDSITEPGSSYLWVGSGTVDSSWHHLDREQVSELIVYLQRWLITGSFRLEDCACGGKRWVDDENWQPDEDEMRRGREPHSGLIPCGFCNEGGWGTPVGGPS